MWNKEDPRETISKRAQIIIYTGEEALVGRVNTKDSWCIWTNHEFNRYKFISACDNWPNHWLWAYTPK
jgi:hypothetical protein